MLGYGNDSAGPTPRQIGAALVQITSIKPLLPTSTWRELFSRYDLLRRRLLVSQRDKRIYTRGAQCWNVRGTNGDQEQQQGDDGQRKRIRWLDAE
jgi:hypothetical protein